MLKYTISYYSKLILVREMVFMKLWKKAVIAIIVITVIVSIIGILGYYFYVNRKVESEDVSSLKNYDNLAVQADISFDNKDVTKKLTDGRKTTAVKVSDGDNIYLSFEEPVTCNTIVLRETLNKSGSLAYALEGGTKQFSIYATYQDEETLIYQNDKIDTYRMCTFPETKFDALRIQFDSCRGSAKLRDISIFNVPKTNDDFRINDYFIYEDEDYQHNEKFKSYLNKVTDLTMFIGVGLGEDGEVTYSPDKETFIKRLDDVRAAIGDRDIKLYCNVFSGDADSTFFSEHSKDIAKNLADFVTEFSLDGVDFDWEYPSGGKDWAAYNQLALDLHESLSKIGKKFSFATAVWNMRFSDEAKEAVDYFNIMIYDHISDDYNGYHSTFKETTLAIERLYYQGYNMKKICLGMPYYGRNLKNSEYDNYWIDYSNSNITDPWTNFSEKATFINKDTGEKSIRPAYFNGYAMVRDKTAYAISMSLGGIMTWSMMGDVPTDEDLCLHNAVMEACNQRLENFKLAE